MRRLLRWIWASENLWLLIVAATGVHSILTLTNPTDTGRWWVRLIDALVLFYAGWALPRQINRAPVMCRFIGHDNRSASIVGELPDDAHLELRDDMSRDEVIGWAKGHGLIVSTTCPRCGAGRIL